MKASCTVEESPLWKEFEFTIFCWLRLWITALPTAPLLYHLYHYWLFSVWRLDFICKNYLKAKVMSRSCYSKIKTSSTDLRKGRQSFTSMKRRPICLIWRWHGFQITKNIYQNSACLRVSHCAPSLPSLWYKEAARSKHSQLNTRSARQR